MTRWLACIVLVGCGPAPECESPCGVPLFGSKDCQGFAAAEDRAVRALSQVPEFQGRDICKGISTVVSVTITPSGEMLKDGLAGSTWCSGPGAPGHIRLDGWYTWRDSALTHEFVHHLVGCRLEGNNHPQWTERGIYEAIEVSRRLDSSSTDG